MKSKLLFLLIACNSFQLLSAQTFTEAPQIPPFEAISSGSIAFSDIDGDNDPDLLITGWTNSNSISKLYINDGLGHFTEMTDTPFVGVYGGSIAFSDVDGDNDQDLFITGFDISPLGISKLYINDGMGNFTEMTGTPFVTVHSSSIAFSDVDGDNDQDLLITGRNGPGPISPKLYTNDGLGNFTEMAGTPFEAVYSSSIAFSDVDGDNDPDLLITGWNGSNTISKLYTNDGLGNFTEIPDTPFQAVEAGSIAFSDVDGDNDQDLFITGFNSSTLGVSKLYINDGMGNFTEKTGPPFISVYSSSIAFSDVDNDNDPDLLITGRNGADGISKLYINDGLGNFTVMLPPPFEGLEYSSIAFSDVDGDSDSDILVTGSNYSDNPISKLYLNDGLVSSLENMTPVINFEFTLFPNPTRVEYLYVNYLSEENTRLVAKVFDLNGSLLRQQREQFGIGVQIFSIDITSLPKGTYTIQLDDGKRIGTRKFVVQ